MARNDQDETSPINTGGDSERRSSASRDMDIRDSKRDQERLKPDETIIELPDVSDIPGQEHVHVAPLGELADTTISSDDEEGVGLFDDDEEDDTIISMGTEADIPGDDKKTLERGEEFMPTRDEVRLERASLDEEDFEGDPLNERALGTARSGSDLDVPGAELDDERDALGQGDEENNHYSLGSDSNDNVTEGTP